MNSTWNMTSSHARELFLFYLNGINDIHYQRLKRPRCCRFGWRKFSALKNLTRIAYYIRRIPHRNSRAIHLNLSCPPPPPCTCIADDLCGTISISRRLTTYRIWTLIGRTTYNNARIWTVKYSNTIFVE